MALILLLQPRELQSISRLTTRADSLSVKSSLFKDTLLTSAALKSLNFHQSLLRFTEILPRTHLQTQTFSMWSIHRQKVAPLEIILRQSSTPQLSGAMEPEAITISSVASPEPQIVTIESGSDEPTFPYAFDTQHPIVPPSLNDHNLPPNPFNVLATMAVIQHDQEDSYQSPEPSDPSPISTLPVILSTIEGWETPHTTTDDNTFSSSENESRRVYWDFSADEKLESKEPRRV